MTRRAFTWFAVAFLWGGMAAAADPPAAETAAPATETEAETTNAESDMASYLPEFLTEARLGKELFGGRTGYVHPFVSLTEYYTDNLFNVPEDEEDDFITVLSPGIWGAFPARSWQPLQVTTLNSAPGGLAVTRFPIESQRRLQTFGLYRADLTRHQEFSGEDNTYQRAEGLLSLNLRGGLSLELLDIYEVEQDPYSTGISRKQEEFTSNLAQLIASYRISPKTRVRSDFTHYTLEFDSDRNAFREREDDLVSLYGFYRLFPKSSVLLQYDYIDINYDQEILSDSEEQRLQTGLVWEVTNKTRGTIKAGYAWRAVEAGEDREEFIGEARLDHRFTPKTAAYLLFTRRISETDIPQSQDVLSHRAQVGYRQQLLPRLSSSADLYYYRDNYRGGDRDDDYYGARLGLGYLFRSWLTFGLGYHYLERDSTDEDFDYTKNTLYLTITASL